MTGKEWTEERRKRWGESQCKICNYQYVLDIRKRNRYFVKTHLANNPCEDCGESDIIVLQFDHVEPGRSIARLASKSVSLETIKIEIAKCEIRCANCHVRRHYYAQ